MITIEPCLVHSFIEELDYCLICGASKITITTK